MQHSHTEMRRYLNRISGPLLDRIDIHVEVQPVAFEELSEKRKGESSKNLRARVVAARRLQQQRFTNQKAHCNAQMNVRQIRAFCPLRAGPSKLLASAMERLRLSARAYDRILKVARTIADLDGKEELLERHLAEAIQYRSLDREGWLG
jgi:magnesium chelatase family protein